MRISNTALNSFIELYRKKYGIVLSDDEAMEIATNYLSLIEVVELNTFTNNNKT